nr:DUF429 domain-containing protein [Chthonobacter rhizosphaerae]
MTGYRVAAALPLPGPNVRGAGLKAFEDRLDAVVCAWVGIEALGGRAVPYGGRNFRDLDTAIAPHTVEKE